LSIGSLKTVVKPFMLVTLISELCLRLLSRHPPGWSPSSLEAPEGGPHSQSLKPEICSGLSCP